MKLSPTYSKYSDASDGPLQPGDVGRLLENDHSNKPYLVEAPDGRQWWYEYKALVKTLPGDGNAASAAKTDGMARGASEDGGRIVDSDEQS